MIPTGKLGTEYWLTNPPKVAGFGVFVNGKLVAVLEKDQVLDEIKSMERKIRGE